jgi:putative phosphoesterase
MKVVILSDTHIPKRAKQLPEALKKGLQEAGLILHAGDWQTPDVYEVLRKYAPVEGVAGNVDGEEIISLFGRKKIVAVENIRIGLVHGDGVHKTTEKRVYEAFAEENVDVIVFGHSHIPLMKELGGRILFNPGSPTDKRRQPQYSYGVLTVTGEDMRLEHIYFDDKN